MPTLTQTRLHDAREALLTALDSVEPIVTMSHEDLVVIALGSRIGRSDADYLTLTDAASGAFDFTELDAGGRVPTVQVKVGFQPLVVLAGETIVGGKQNRIINVSLWLGAQKTTPIPVSCLEHGRWNSGSRFAAGRPVDLDMRAKVSKMVARSAHGPMPQYASDQGEVWREISEKERLASRYSATAALHELYEAEAPDVDAVVKAFPVPEGAIGLAVGVDGNVVAMDLFDSAATLRKQWPRLIASAASARLDFQRRVAASLLPKPDHRYPDPGAVGRMLARAKAATAAALVNESAGEGWDVRLETHRLHGSALVHDGRAVHVALFRDDA